MARIRVKICGITRVEDAVVAAMAGADAIGLVFYDKSPRSVDIDLAKSIADAIPPFVSKVGLFVNAKQVFLGEVLKRVPLDILQFHGEETAEQCDEYDLPFIKAVRMREDTDLQHIEKSYKNAKALLLDTYVPGIAGGTGKPFDWARVPGKRQKPLVLAGGLDPENVVNAIEQVQPFAVDVSGGVELSKGIKDHNKLRAFMRAVARA